LENNIDMKKKVVRLTEEDLTRIVKKVINEQSRVPPWIELGLSKSTDDKNLYNLKKELITYVQKNCNRSSRQYAGIVKNVFFKDGKMFAINISDITGKVHKTVEIIKDDEGDWSYRGNAGVQFHPEKSIGGNLIKLKDGEWC
jgi:hypothetical protein